MPNRKKHIVFVLILASLPVVALVLAEGVAGWAAFARALRSSGRAEERHTEPDTLVGWINERNVYLPNMYGRGLDFRTNSQRFRHDGDVSPTPPPGRRRVVCSGDSFTMGYGVGNADAWCEKLSKANPTLETINMGQGGYGVDQAYLWYLRDGLALHPAVHLFAFIETDFERMKSDRFMGAAKPQLAHTGDAVHATNVPVAYSRIGIWRVSVGRAVEKLRVYNAISYALHNAPARPARPPSDSATWETARAALHDLVRRDSAAGIELYVVLLPTAADYNTPYSAKYRRWLRDAAARHEFRFVDLVEPLRRVSGDSVLSLFIDGVGHYTVAGNAWVTEQLREQIPVLADRSTEASSPRSAFPASGR